MFIILKPIDAPDGFFASRKLKKAIDEKPAEFIGTADGMPFATIEVFCGKNGIEWKKFIEKCGRYTSRVIAPSGIILPLNQQISSYAPAWFPAELCLNTAVEILETVKLRPDSFVLTLCDSDARFAERLPILIPLCSSVRVITGKIEKYVPICTEIIEKTGASVVLRSAFEKSSKRDAVIFCSGNKDEISSADIVFSTDRNLRGRTTVIGSDIVITEEHKNVIGKGIDSVVFASAVTELCGSHLYEKSLCERIDIIRRGGESAFADLISTLADNEQLIYT